MIQNCEEWLIHQSCAAIHRDLHRVERWADRKSLTLCSSTKKNAVGNNPMHKYYAGDQLTEKQLCRKGHPGPSEHNTECEVAMHP